MAKTKVQIYQYSIRGKDKGTTLYIFNTWQRQRKKFAHIEHLASLPIFNTWQRQRCKFAYLQHVTKTKAQIYQFSICGKDKGIHICTYSTRGKDKGTTLYIFNTWQRQRGKFAHIQHVAKTKVQICPSSTPGKKYRRKHNLHIFILHHVANTIFSTLQCHGCCHQCCGAGAGTF